MVTGRGNQHTALEEKEIREIVAATLPAEQFRGQRVLVLTPDATRTCPLPLMINLLREMVGPEAAQLDFMVALGSHQPLSSDQILALYGISPADRQGPFAASLFYNHRWDLAETFHRLGSLTEQETGQLSGGLLREKVPVDINKVIFDYDRVLILGPVFPHEVVGFSGGAKYFFPGISGGEFLHFFHWLGAVATCSGTIGIKDTPVRAVINRAMQLVDRPVDCLAMVVKSGRELYGLYGGGYLDAWEAAANLSARVHVVYKDHPFHTVLGICPEMYSDLWTGGKVMYKLEQIVAPGGRLIIYAPHIREVSKSWGRYLEKIGYHTVGYYLEHPGKFADVPRGVLAHSTHVRGAGTMQNGVEKPRIEVVLATSLSAAQCRQINLGYLDYRQLDLDTYRGREKDGILLVDRAGEILHKVKPS